MKKICPSILAADFTKLGEEIRDIEDAGADIIHCDIMDGHFVPNISYGPEIVSQVKQITKLPLDVHLMINDPQLYIEDFRNAGADYISVHHENNYIHRLFMFLFCCSLRCNCQQLFLKLLSLLALKS